MTHMLKQNNIEEGTDLSVPCFFNIIFVGNFIYLLTSTT